MMGIWRTLAFIRSESRGIDPNRFVHTSEAICSIYYFWSKRRVACNAFHFFRTTVEQFMSRKDLQYAETGVFRNKTKSVVEAESAIDHQFELDRDFVS